MSMKTRFAIMLLVALVPSATLGQEAHARQSASWQTFESARESLQEDPERVLFLFAEADWCAICKRMRREVFTDHVVKERLQADFALVSLDVDSREEIEFFGKALAKRKLAYQLDVRGTPTLIFLSGDGDLLAMGAGFVEPARMALLLEWVASDTRHRVSFDTFVRDRKGER